MITLKINIAMNGHKIGDKINLQTDIDGNIIDSFWSRRLADAKIDNCVEVVLPENEIGEKSKKGIK
jgi:hypothetical protein